MANETALSWKSIVKQIPALEKALRELFAQHKHSLTPVEYAEKLLASFTKEFASAKVSKDVLAQLLINKLMSLGYMREKNARVVDIISRIHDGKVTESDGIEALHTAGFRIASGSLRDYARSMKKPFAPKVEIKRFGDEECLRIIQNKLQDGPVYTQQLSVQLHLPAQGIVRLYDKLKQAGLPLIHDRPKQRAYLITNLPTDIPVAELGEELDEMLKRLKDAPAFERVTRILLVSDTRIGKKASQMEDLRKIYKRAEEKGVAFAIYAGNLFAGPPSKGHEDEFFATGMYGQVEAAARWFPKAFFNTHIVGGPRDNKWLVFKPKKGEAFEESLRGRNPIQVLCERRRDLIYEGMFQAVFPVFDTKVFVMARGDDNAPYGMSYPLQGLVEMLKNEHEPGEEPRVVVEGGWQSFVHLPNYLGRPGTDAIMVPATHRLDARQLRKKRRGRGPTIGAVILEIHFDVDKDGKLQRKKIRDVVVEAIDLTAHKTKDDWRKRYSSSPEAEKLSAEERRILELLDERPMRVSELSRDEKLNVSKTDIDKLVKRLQALQFPIHEDPISHRFFLEPVEVDKMPTASVKGLFGKKVKTVLFSDAHLYGIYENVLLLRRVVAEAVERRVQVGFFAGDMGQGWHYFGAEKDLLISPTSDVAKDYIVRYWPKIPRKIDVDSSLDPKNPANLEPLFVVEGISGDHDYKTTFTKVGHDMIRYAAEKLAPAFNYHGYPSAIVAPKAVEPLIVKIVHPDGGPGYAKSYSAQKQLFAAIAQDAGRVIQIVGAVVDREFEEDERVGRSIHALVIGHLHVSLYMIYRGIHVFCVPCLQSKTADYMERKGLEPDIGAWFPTFTFDKEGNAVECRAEYVDLRSDAATFEECIQRRDPAVQTKYFESLEVLVNTKKK